VLAQKKNYKKKVVVQKNLHGYIVYFLLIFFAFWLKETHCSLRSLARKTVLYFIVNL